MTFTSAAFGPTVPQMSRLGTSMPPVPRMSIEKTRRPAQGAE
jgi:hypothetical protein